MSGVILRGDHVQYYPSPGAISRHFTRFHVGLNLETETRFENLLSTQQTSNNPIQPWETLAIRS